MKIMKNAYMSPILGRTSICKKTCSKSCGRSSNTLLIFYYKFFLQTNVIIYKQKVRGRLVYGMGIPLKMEYILLEIENIGIEYVFQFFSLVATYI